MAQKSIDLQVATAGEALIDLIREPDGRLKPCLGGAVYNLTRALARQEVQTLYLNPLSKDRFGRELSAAMLQDGVRLAVPEPVLQVTSLAVVGVNDQGHPDYAFYREGVADRAITAQQMNAACEAAETLSIVCTGALALSPDDADTYLPWLAAQRQSGRTVIVDANLRPSVMPNMTRYRSHVLTALQFADVIKVSDEDLDNLNIEGSSDVERAGALFAQTPAHFVALTRGAQGAALLTRQGQVFYARETAAVQVVDTVGAGDCFLAGMVASMLEQGLAADWGAELVEPSQAQALLFNAIASATLCVMQRGAVPPSRAQVQARVATAGLEFRA
ncbi:PfkB family carbohydrate kinase [Rhodoferax aquaticus]|uniref:Carbohydrate kinase n=1 Tax=Rhodoferax aquaticus TaxID=2527691 RepID=A0A515ERA2_9BURK|nr:PfkB family carbohydrate kinase [Rhodoferax aquaticus]QDL55163.1 carbohydrate kinase [Rhodoferax aquaticus]